MPHRDLAEGMSPELIELARWFQRLAFDGRETDCSLPMVGDFTPAPVYCAQALAILKPPLCDGIAGAWSAAILAVIQATRRARA